ncbi:acetyl-CoA acetyltransferase [Bacillus sp. OxB-1]|uniref:thiolase family protein n=1 Tax=Bacillus sp. (strain OxB-1) TaxID=98228 RepID=UPI000581BC17|nr:thiolase family protein [Bacillus sp. OxB-1]BAQ09069.1 acetyl-CoA acetyltransferase [Bacillus sp. OxB-1]
MKEVVIVSAKRTAIGTFNGMYENVSTKELAKTVMKAVVEESNVPPEAIDEIIVGNVDQSSAFSNVGRIASLELGFPEKISAHTVGQNCASGMQALVNGIQAIKSGDAETILVVGTENMSQIPHLLKGTRSGYRLGHHQVTDKIVEMLHDPFVDMTMGETAEVVAEEHGITREEQDAFALRSHERALQAQRDGIFAKEIVPVTATKRKETVTLEEDQGPNERTSLEVLSSLRTAFKKDGTITAGNACGLNDGAAAMLIMSREKADELGVKPIARIVANASVGVDPKRMGLGPAYAVPKVLEKAGLTMEDIDLVELNEAFAAQALACVKQLELDLEKVNPFGGAIALGHPVGATGLRLIVTLLNGLEHFEKKRGIATLCVGGGIGGAVIVERV